MTVLNNLQQNHIQFMQCNEEWEAVLNGEVITKDNKLISVIETVIAFNYPCIPPKENEELFQQVVNSIQGKKKKAIIAKVQLN